MDAYTRDAYVCCLCASKLRPSVRTGCKRLEAQLRDYSVHRMYVCGACVREIWRGQTKLEDIESGSEEDQRLHQEFWYICKDEVWTRLERRWGAGLYRLTYVKMSACE